MREHFQYLRIIFALIMIIMFFMALFAAINEQIQGTGIAGICFSILFLIWLISPEKSFSKDLSTKTDDITNSIDEKMEYITQIFKSVTATQWAGFLIRILSLIKTQLEERHALPESQAKIQQCIDEIKNYHTLKEQANEKTLSALPRPPSKPKNS